MHISTSHVRALQHLRNSLVYKAWNMSKCTSNGDHAMGTRLSRQLYTFVTRDGILVSGPVPQRTGQARRDSASLSSCSSSTGDQVEPMLFLPMPFLYNHSAPFIPFFPPRLVTKRPDARSKLTNATARANALCNSGNREIADSLSVLPP